MRTAIILEQAEIDRIISGEGLTLTLANGQTIEIRAESNGKLLPESIIDPPPPARKAKGRKTRRGKYRQRLASRKGSRAEQKAAKQNIFFRVYKETRDIKRASKQAGVSTSWGYRWRMESEGKTRSSPKAGRPGQFDCPNTNCDRGFRTIEARARHIRRDHPQDLNETV